MEITFAKLFNILLNKKNLDNVINKNFGWFMIS